MDEMQLFEIYLARLYVANIYKFFAQFDNKHQLLLEVSHELRSPLARMQLLIAMIPKHKNIEKLKE